MDAHLKRLAEIGLKLTEAEEALEENAYTVARELLDEVDTGLDELRSAWPTMSKVERDLVGRTAKPLRERLDAARKRLPRLVALAEVPVEERIVDPEQDDDDGPPAAA